MVAITGALGGLGANVAREALARGLAVRALVRRDPPRAEEGLEYVQGDAARLEDLIALVRGADALLHCVNVHFDADWDRTVLSLLEKAVEACRREDVRLVFPANVWVFGRGRRGHRIAEGEALAPVSNKGRVRATQEELLRSSGVRFAMVRLPEFYGPHVGTLTGPPLRRVATGRSVVWFGDADLDAELVFMPDAARALLEVACAADADGTCFHLPGARAITPRAFFAEAFRQSGRGGRLFTVPAWLVHAASPLSPLARGFSDILHLWEDPILLDGSRYRRRFGTVPATSYEEGIAATLAWLRDNPTAPMHY